MTAEQLATMLVRLFGAIFIFVATLGLVFVGSFLFLYSIGAPDWVFRSLAPYAVQSFVASPAWLLGGFLTLKCSRRIGGFVARLSGSDRCILTRP